MDFDQEPCGCNCDYIQAEIVRLLDEGLDPQACRAIRAEIACCPHCAARLAREEEIRALVRRCCLAHEPAPVTLRTRITAQIRIVRRG